MLCGCDNGALWVHASATMGVGASATMGVSEKEEETLDKLHIVQSESKCCGNNAGVGGAAATIGASISENGGWYGCA